MHPKLLSPPLLDRLLQAVDLLAARQQLLEVGFRDVLLDSGDEAGRVGPSVGIVRGSLQLVEPQDLRTQEGSWIIPRVPGGLGGQVLSEES